MHLRPIRILSSFVLMWTFSVMAVPAGAQTTQPANWASAVARLAEAAAGKDQPVAVILLWRQDRTDTYTSKTSHPVFILIKGQIAEDKCYFRHIVYGDPLEASH